MRCWNKSKIMLMRLKLVHVYKMHAPRMQLRIDRIFMSPHVHKLSLSSFVKIYSVQIVIPLVYAMLLLCTNITSISKCNTKDVSPNKSSILNKSLNILYSKYIRTHGF